MPTFSRSHIAILASAVLFTSSPSSAVEIETQTLDGLRVMTLSGEFRPEESPRRLATELATFAPDIVTFNSPGGNVYAAMAFGRALRAHGATTFQLRALECASACALAFLGGEERVAQPGSIGMHKASFIDSEALSAEDAVSAVQSTTADVVAYLVEMGVDPGLLDVALRYESWDIRYLSGSEMVSHRVVTAQPLSAEEAAPAPPPPAVASRPDASPSTGPGVGTGDARSGIVRRPKGYAAILAEPSTSAEELRMLENGTPVTILGTTDRWYRVRSGAYAGWTHHTWVKVDQFYDAGFDAKHVQIKSFDNERDTAAYLGSMPFPLDVYAATNGWLAVTLDGTYTADAAAGLLAQMKATGQIPDDSFQTYGNTYMQKLCCD